jgi:hypothetical protein
VNSPKVPSLPLISRSAPASVLPKRLEPSLPAVL